MLSFKGSLDMMTAPGSPALLFKIGPRRQFLEFIGPACSIRQDG